MKSVRRLVATRPTRVEELHRKKPEHEAADVREEGDPAAGFRLHERVAARDELEDEPDAEIDESRNLEEEEGQHPREDAPARKEQEVRAEHAGDRAARAQVRNLAVLRGAVAERDERLRRGRRKAGEKVKRKKADLP